MENRFDSVLVGMICGIIGPVIGFFLYYYIFRHEPTLEGFWNIAIQRSNIPKVMSLSVIANLLIFFLFVRSNRLLASRGVLLGTFLWIIPIIYYRFF